MLAFWVGSLFLAGFLAGMLNPKDPNIGGKVGESLSAPFLLIGLGLTRKVFLSSTYIDLVAHRLKVIEALERLGHQVGKMEVFGARTSEPAEASLAEVESSDLFIGVYAHRYGYIPPGTDKSITEAEFRHAGTHDIPVLAFLVDEDWPWPPKLVEHGRSEEKLNQLKAELRRELVVDTFTTPDDLGFKVATAVGRLLSESSPEASRTPTSSKLVVQLRHAETLRQLLKLALKLTCAATQTDYNQIFLVGATEYERHLVCVAESISKGKQSYRIASLRGLLGRALLEGQILNVGNVHTWPGYFQAVPETHSELVVPILAQGLPVGVVNSESEDANYYGPPIVSAVRAIAEALGELLPDYGWSPGQDSRLLPRIPR
jgi:putative methionine-R-sulfoxide reductase with GAF domain